MKYITEIYFVKGPSALVPVNCVRGTRSDAPLKSNPQAMPESKLRQGAGYDAWIRNCCRLQTSRAREGAGSARSCA